MPENLTDTFARVDTLWKLIWRAQAGRAGMRELELYDRRTDPADLRDVAAAHPDVTARFKAEIGRWIEMQNRVNKELGPAGAAPLDDETLKRLRSLGYLGGKER